MYTYIYDYIPIYTYQQLRKFSIGGNQHSRLVQAAAPSRGRSALFSFYCTARNGQNPDAIPVTKVPWSGFYILEGSRGLHPFQTRAAAG